VASQGRVSAARRNGDQQIAATHNGRNNEVGLVRSVHHVHPDTGAQRIITYLGIHLALVGGRDHEGHPGKILDRVPPFDERQRGGVDEPREGGRETRAHHRYVSPRLEEADRLAGPDFAAADDEDPTITET